VPYLYRSPTKEARLIPIGRFDEVYENTAVNSDRPPGFELAMELSENKQRATP